jgi:hypothetical protein
MCARYTVQRATRRWTMAMFYGIINIAAVNLLVIYAHNMRKDQPEKKFSWSGDNICNTTIKQSTLSRSIKTAIVVCGFVSDSKGNTMQDPKDYEVISRKWGSCHVCSRSRDVKTHTLARLRMKLMNLISYIVFPTLLILQTILSYVHSWSQKLTLNITGIYILWRLNDNHAIVIWGCHFCDVKLLFFCK